MVFIVLHRYCSDCCCSAGLSLLLFPQGLVHSRAPAGVGASTWCLEPGDWECLIDEALFLWCHLMLLLCLFLRRGASQLWIVGIYCEYFWICEGSTKLLGLLWVQLHFCGYFVDLVNLRSWQIRRSATFSLVHIIPSEPESVKRNYLQSSVYSAKQQWWVG